MARRKRSGKKERPGNLPFAAAAIENHLAEAEDYLSQRKPEQALEALQKAPARVQRHPHYLSIRGTAFALLGDFDSALNDLELAAGRTPEIANVYLNLAILYAQQEFWSHAWQAAERFLKSSPADREGRDTVRQVIEFARNELVEKARQTGLPLEKYRQAAYSNEKVQRQLAAGDYGPALKEAEQATRHAPNWAPPRNNRALILFYMGQLEQAIAEEQAVLEEIDPANIPALGNLILFHTCSWQPEQARPYAEQLKDLLKSSPLDGLDLTKAIESLGIWEDDEALWELAGRLMDASPDALLGSTWYILGASAANTGHVPEAKRLLERAQEQAPGLEQWIQPALQAVEKARRGRKQPVGTCLTGRFPYLHFRQLWPGRIGRELLELTAGQKGGEAIQRQLEKYVARYPYTAYAGKQILWCEADEHLRQLGMDLLSAASHPAAYQELRCFATSQYGSDQERMKAMARLRAKGQLAPDENIRFWSANEGQWREIQFRVNVVEEAYQPPCNPRALALVDQGTQALAEGRDAPENQARAAQLLQKALAIDPNCAIAIHNLGTVMILQGEVEAGTALLRRAVAADPGYLFGYTSLAELELKENNHAACKDHLDKVFSAPRVPSNAMVRALDIQVRLAIAQRETKSAEVALETLKSIVPDYPGLAHLEMLIMLANTSSNWSRRWIEGVHRYHERQLKKPLSGDDNLSACLDRVSREALAGTLNFWRLPTTGRKAEVIGRLAEAMLDPEQLEPFIQQGLDEREQQALAWVLEGGGVRPWAEFTEIYGDDFDESPYWNYHTPESTPGILRMAGLLAVGTLDNRQVVLIPGELRSLLKQILPSENR